MKATINGVRYNTETATWICAGSGYGPLALWTAILYRTPRVRRFFLVGSGGPMTRFAAQGRFETGDGLHPMTYSDAHLFVFTFGTPDELAAFREEINRPTASDP